MRLQKLLVMLTAIGCASFAVALFCFRPADTNFHAAVLSPMGILFGVSSWLMSQALGKTEKLYEVRLGTLQSDLFHQKIDKRKARLFVKYLIGFGGTFVAILSGLSADLIVR